MTNVTPLSNINYDAILHELTKPCSYDIDSFSKNMGFDLTDYKSLAECLNEINTVWIGSGRQRGKTDWAASLLKKEPKSIAVTINPSFRESLLSKMDKGFDRSRVYSVYTIRNRSTALHEQTPLGIKLIVVDDAAYILERIKRKKLFEWIAYHGSKDTRVIMVTT